MTYIAPKQNGPDIPEQVPNQRARVEGSHGHEKEEVVVNSGASSKDTMAPAESMEAYLDALSKANVQQREVADKSSAQDVKAAKDTQQASEDDLLAAAEALEEQVAQLQQQGASPEEIEAFTNGFDDGFAGVTDSPFLTNLNQTHESLKERSDSTFGTWAFGGIFHADFWNPKPLWDAEGSNRNDMDKYNAGIAAAKEFWDLYQSNSSLASSLTVAQNATDAVHSGAASKKVADALGSDPTYGDLSSHDKKRALDQATAGANIALLKMAAQELGSALNAPGLPHQIAGNIVGSPDRERPTLTADHLPASYLLSDPDPNAPILTADQLRPAIEKHVFDTNVDTLGEERAQRLAQTASQLVVDDDGIIVTGKNQLKAIREQGFDADRADDLYGGIVAFDTPDSDSDLVRLYARGAASGTLSREGIVGEGIAPPNVDQDTARLRRLGETPM